MLAEADQDGDGALSWDEFKNAHEARLKERFSRLDADQNGMIEEEEIQAAAQWRQGRMGGRRGLKGSIEN
jgi:Ca2+-binding EF-hand superfamily protein